MMEKYCDNRSVGVVIRNDDNELALLKRGRFPAGIAPAAGHIDSHGSPEQAAIDEVYEELGVVLSLDALKRTTIRRRRVENICRRIGGGYHLWDVYEAHVPAADLCPDPTETQGAEWVSLDGLQQLVDHTWDYVYGDVSENDWQQNPGLEPVWLPFLTELGYITSVDPVRAIR